MRFDPRRVEKTELSIFDALDVGVRRWIWMYVDVHGLEEDSRSGRCPEEAPVRPQYGVSVRTSLKNVPNLSKTSKLRQNSVKVTVDTREVRPQYGDSVRTSWKNVFFFLC